MAGDLYPYMMPMQSSVAYYTEHATPDGKVYYYNALTKTSQWDKPPATATIIKVQPQKVEQKQASFFSALNILTSGDNKQTPVYVLIIKSIAIIYREEDLQDAIYSYSTYQPNGV